MNFFFKRISECDLTELETWDVDSKSEIPNWWRSFWFFCFFFFLLSKYSYNIKQKIHRWRRMVLIYILSFDFINFVKEFLKKLELLSKLKRD